MGDWEGKDATVSMDKGRVSWGYAAGATPDMRQYFNGIGALLDYALIPGRTVRVGEKFTLDRLTLAQLVPPTLIDLPDYEVRITFTRRPDEAHSGRSYACFDGEGEGKILFPDGTFSTNFKLDQASMRIDITDPGNLFLTSLRIKAPLDGRALQRKSAAIKVEWDGAVDLLTDYTVTLVQ